MENLKIKRPILRYHGGKFKLAPWIISHFPKHRVYVEGFGGAASVLMQKEKCYAEIYNDTWNDVVNVFEILRDSVQSKLLIEQLILTPFSRYEFEKSNNLTEVPIEDTIERARLTIYRSFSGFGSASANSSHNTGFRSNSNRSGSTPAHDWANYPQHLISFIERLRGVCIENRDYQLVSTQHDSEKTLHFFDPPYLHSTRKIQKGNEAYMDEMAQSDHLKLLSFSKSLKGMVIISAYESEMYNDELKGWRISKKDTYADGAKPRTECLYINPQATIKSEPINLFK